MEVHLRLQLYLPDMNKKYYKCQIGQFVDLFLLKLEPAFKNIDAEAEEHGNNYFDGSQYSCPEDFDPGDLAEQAMDQAIKHYEFLCLGKYVLIASWHVALFEAFEQQVRYFFHKELSHNYRISINQVFSRFDDLKIILVFYCVDLNALRGLKEIDHLRLLSNVIKHGEGESANELRRKRPDLFKSYDDVELLELYGSSLLKEVLIINQDTLKDFGKAIEQFWDSFPERSYCDSPDKLLEYLNNKLRK
jgi:hypothetical protein